MKKILSVLSAALALSMFAACKNAADSESDGAGLALAQLEEKAKNPIQKLAGMSDQDFVKGLWYSGTAIQVPVHDCGAHTADIVHTLRVGNVGKELAAFFYVKSYQQDCPDCQAALARMDADKKADVWNEGHSIMKVTSITADKINLKFASDKDENGEGSLSYLISDSKLSITGSNNIMNINEAGKPRFKDMVKISS